VARLAPIRPAQGHDPARAALQRIRQRAKARRLGPFDWVEWKALHEEGRP